jgi:hypothetical protein
MSESATFRFEIDSCIGKIESNNLATPFRDDESIYTELWPGKETGKSSP